VVHLFFWAINKNFRAPFKPLNPSGVQPEKLVQVQAPEPKIKDEKLLHLLRSEETREQGFRLLLSQYEKRLYLHIRRMVDEHEDASDVLQNCLLKVFRNIAGFKGQSALYTWLYRIASNEALSFLKKRQRRRSSSGAPRYLEQMEQLTTDPAVNGDLIELKLQKALNGLPQRQKQVFVLRYYDELSYREMAEILNTSVGSLKASYHHAVKKIETYIINDMI